VVRSAASRARRADTLNGTVGYWNCLNACPGRRSWYRWSEPSWLAGLDESDHGLVELVEEVAQVRGDDLEAAATRGRVGAVDGGVGADGEEDAAAVAAEDHADGLTEMNGAIVHELVEHVAG
jgi:hypothetical protein